MKRHDIFLHYPFGIDTGLGRLLQEPDYAQHVEQMIKQVLLCGQGERINRPDFCCGLRTMVFAPNSEVTATLTRVLILQSLEKWLGSVISVERVEVKAEEEKLNVTIAYIIKSRQERRYLNMEVTV